jgi:pectin methylesterase-like acyl-CoA thioesterase
MSRSPQLAAALAVLVVVCFLSGAPTAAADTRWVNDDGVAVPPGNSCNNPGYSTVQAAVNAAASGDRINVCPGTYTEEVLIPASFGWDANYAWDLDSALGVPLEAADYDWPAAYATVDTATLLQLLPQIRVSTRRAPMLPFK